MGSSPGRSHVVQFPQDPLHVLGLMCGTSVDSIDAAICKVYLSPDNSGLLRSDLLSFYEHPVPPGLRSRIFSVFENGPGSLALACSLNFEIGEAFAEASLEAIRHSGMHASQVDLIASHGQTLYHIPPHMADSGNHASTLQLGEAAVIAQRTGVPVVADFRVADMAAGGNGAPLVPFADFHLFSSPGENVIVHNIGGISNCTWLPASANPGDILAFDTGPGNMIMDALVQEFFPGETFDRDGLHAAAGSVIEPLLQQWMESPYIKAAPPKSTGRELFGVQFAREILQKNPGHRPEDLLATARAFTADSFVENYRQFLAPRGPVSRVLVAGGGAFNPGLMERIQHGFHALASSLGHPSPKVTTLEAAGFPSKARECMAFALLGYGFVRGIPGNIPSATGATRPVVLGKYTHPA